MLNKFMMGVALSAVALSGALAQSNPTTSPTPNPPAMQSPAPSGTTTPPAATPSTQGQMTSGDKFVTTQSPDQWLASKFKGTDVLGSDDKKIGDVSDILFDKSGKIEAFVVSVGGFLGMGSKDVAIAPTAFDVVKGTNGNSDKLKLSMSQDELKQAQNFEPYKSPTTTTGSGAIGSGSPAGGMRPGGAPPASGR
jgi:hypothetical protein